MVDFSKYLDTEEKTRKTIEISGLRTNCFSGESFTVTLLAFLTDGLHGKVFKIDNGPTGYESFYLDENIIKIFRQEGKPWVACMGTSRSWDKLVIPNEEMIKAFDYLEIA